jgi:hypothetical protein
VEDFYFLSFGRGFKCELNIVGTILSVEGMRGAPSVPTFHPDLTILHLILGTFLCFLRQLWTTARKHTRNNPRRLSRRPPPSTFFGFFFGGGGIWIFLPNANKHETRNSLDRVTCQKTVLSWHPWTFKSINCSYFYLKLRF